MLMKRLGIVYIVLNIILHDCVQFDSVHMKDVCFVAHINLNSPQAKLILYVWVQVIGLEISLIPSFFHAFPAACEKSWTIQG